MSVIEHDGHTGKPTTGHEWDGIKELDTPNSKIVNWFYAITFAWCVVYWILMPAWPLISSYTPGILGFHQRQVVEQSLVNAAADRAAWQDGFEQLDLGDIAADPELRAIALQAGRVAFGNHCAMCHGTDAAGRDGFPDLTDRAWLRGGSLDAIHETLRVGINSTHEETRFAEMLAFGRDGILERQEILDVVTFVQSLSQEIEGQPDEIERGRAIFEENCASCHGEEGLGGSEIGAPNLTDSSWIYGGDREAIYSSVYSGRRGWMPHWSERLDSVTVKKLTIYVHSLGGGE